MTQFTISHPALSGASGHQPGLIARARLGLKRYRTYRRTRAELSRLSDRELGDVDIRRNQIDAIARQAAEDIA